MERIAEWIQVARTCRACECDFAVEVAAGTHENCLPVYCDQCSPRKPKKRECRWCKKQYVKKQGNGSLNKFCCEGHRDAYYAYQAEQQAKAAEKRKADRAKRTKRCQRCAVEFCPTHGHCKYCPDCAVHVRATGQEADCVKCGKVFSKNGRRAKYCNKCRIVVERERIARSRSVRAERQHEATSLHLSAKTGTIGELLFDVLCVRNSWLSACPVCECNPGWDRIVYMEQSPSRVQVKSVDSSKRPLSDHVIFRAERPITKVSCDIVAIVDVATADIWLISADDREGTKFHPSDWEEVRHNAMGID